MYPKHRNWRRTLTTSTLLGVAAVAATTGVVLAQAPQQEMPFVMSAGGRNARLPLTDGRQIYEHVCQSCHMADARGGALSPATYPALVDNARLAARAYPAMLVINGQGAMPAFGTMLSDEQVAAVVNYLRGSFGNTYADTLSPDEVKMLRPAAQTAPTELRGR